MTGAEPIPLGRLTATPALSSQMRTIRAETRGTECRVSSALGTSAVVVAKQRRDELAGIEVA